LHLPQFCLNKANVRLDFSFAAETDSLTHLHENSFHAVWRIVLRISRLDQLSEKLFLSAPRGSIPEYLHTMSLLVFV
jgi:hypothetical protein